MSGRSGAEDDHLFQFFLLGTMPLGDWAPIQLMVPVSAVGAAITLALFLGTIMATPRAATRDLERGHRENRDVMSTDQLRPAA